MLKAPMCLNKDLHGEDAPALDAVAAANGAPSNVSTTPTIPHASMQSCDAVDLYAVAPLAGSYRVAAVWWRYPAPQRWVVDGNIPPVVVNAGTDEAFPLLPANARPCADAVYIEVDTFVGGALANVWLQGQVEVP